MSKLNVNISSPWVTFYREIEALFGSDPEIKIVFDEDKNEIKLYVDNHRKADALTQLLPSKREFGNVTLLIDVVPPNVDSYDIQSLYEAAFENNPAFAYVEHVDGLFTMDYVVFKNKVVQYFNDDMSDVHGNCSTLYQEIAKNVLETVPGVFFCTDVEE